MKFKEVLIGVSFVAMSLTGCKNAGKKDEIKKVSLNEVMNAGYQQGVKETAEQMRDAHERQGGYGARQRAVAVMSLPRSAPFYVTDTLYRDLDLVAQGRWVDLKIKDSDWMIARRHELDPYNLVHFRVKQREQVMKTYEKEERIRGKANGGYPFPVNRLTDEQRTRVQRSRENVEEQRVEVRSRGPIPANGQTIEFERN